MSQDKFSGMIIPEYLRHVSAVPAPKAVELSIPTLRFTQWCFTYAGFQSGGGNSILAN